MAMPSPTWTPGAGSDGRRAAEILPFARGTQVYAAGEAGGALRVLSGVVRLDRERGEGPEFGGLALAGDVIGAETLVFGAYTYSATALSAVVLESWLAGASADTERKLMLALSASERRMADALALRCGKAAARIRRLLDILAGAGARDGPPPRAVLPRLKDIADITDLKIETVSRTISQLNDGGELAIEDHRRGRLFHTVGA